MQLSAGAITAGGCLGILIPPSVLLIVYGATAGVSVVKLYAGAFFPGLMLAGLYILYVIIVAKIKPSLAPPLSAEERRVPLPERLVAIGATANRRVVPALRERAEGPAQRGRAVGLPAAAALHRLAARVALRGGGAVELPTSPRDRATQEDVSELQQMGQTGGTDSAGSDGGGLQEPPSEDSGELAEPPNDSAGGLSEPPAEAPAASPSRRAPRPPAASEPAAAPSAPGVAGAAEAAAGERVPASLAYWISLAVAALAIVVFYALLSFTRLEVFKMLLSSFFPLLVLILAVLGSIVFGLATPTEAAAVGALGGFLLAAAYRQLNFGIVKESVFLTAKTSAMVCWLFVGSAIFSAAFALLGGQELVERWVLGMDLIEDAVPAAVAR